MIVRYLVTIECASEEEAEKVIAERVFFDEDYGFTYSIGAEYHSKEKQ